MRFATFEYHGVVRSGVVAGEGRGTTVHPLATEDTVLDLIEVRLRPPLDPPTVRDFVAFEEHVEGVVASVGDGEGVVPEWYQAPTFYFTNPYAMIGANDDVQIPSGSELFDYELEVAAVVGRDGRSLQPDQVDIFGYTIMNDWSARDLQRREMKVNLGPAKGKDFASTLGPWLVTADELEPYRDADGFLALEMSVSVNGNLIGHDLLSNMGWPFEELVAYASRGAQVRAGDVLGSGTCGNGGCLAELWGRRGTLDPSPLRPGDVVEMTVEGIGTIRNTVTAGTKLPPVTSARSRPRVRKR